VSNVIADGASDAGAVVAPPPSSPAPSSNSSSEQPRDIDAPFEYSNMPERAEKADRDERQIRELLQRVSEKPQRPGATDDAPEPIEAPRSWTREEKEGFAALPRETQEYIRQREDDRDHDLRTRQNLQIADAKARVEQQARAEIEHHVRAAQQLYQASHEEVLLRALHQKNYAAFAQKYGNPTAEQLQHLAANNPQLHGQIMQEFAQLKADDAKLADLAQRQAEKLKTDAVLKYLKDAQTQGAQQLQQQQQIAAWKEQQDALAAEDIPELRGEGAAEFQRQAAEYLQELGITAEEACQVPQIFDHRMQRVFADALRWKRAERAAKAARPVSAPPPQRPGRGAPAKGAESDLASAADRGDMAAYFKMREAGRVR